MEKLTLNISIENNDMEFMLGCAILFIREYDNDKRKKPYFEIAYYIALKCAINNGFYEPLLDISSNFGLYPVSNYILENELHKGYVTTGLSLSYQLEKYRFNSIIETYEQKKSREILVSSEKSENCYIAPTSFGKSSLIIEIIKNKNSLKTAVIVPTKSLLMQTYKLIKKNFPSSDILFHDEMYSGAENFIAIFTQERALRLLKDESISFDIMIIDEAHNIFKMDARSLLLTRLIRRNRHRNLNSINYYLSPLIANADNLKTEENQLIFENKIFNNVKEADVFEFRENGDVRKYNRFLDVFFSMGKSLNYIDYIVENSKEKNFLYLRLPKKVEEFSELLSSRLSYLNSDEINELSQVIAQNVHKDFYCVDYVKKGVVYLHGKLPDLIKEYLEFKFSKTKQVKYIVANSVILEGVNLPVDNMYILNTHALDAKSLTNLIGRVNRLNEVFANNKKSLDKLSPSIHFVNSNFNRVNGKMENKIRMLKSGLFKDSVENPLLVNFNEDKFKNDLDKAQSKNDESNVLKIEEKIRRYEEIKNKEDFLISNDLVSDKKIEKILLESNVLSVYTNPAFITDKLKGKIDEVCLSVDWSDMHVIDKMFLFFIKGFENYISNKEFLRLRNFSARAFYKMFVDKNHRLSLKDHISDTIKYFQSIKNEPQGREFYIGDSYGEFAKAYENNNHGKTVYIDLSSKSSKELANIAMVKIKIENDFISYILNNYVNVLFDFGLLSEKEYQVHIYGTSKKVNSEFVKMGMSGALINKLDKDGQIDNIMINEYGVLICSEDFISYIKGQDELVQFEISKFIDI